MNVQDKTSNRSEAAKFGGFQFTYELELCLESATDILGELLNLKVQELPHPVGLILGNVHHNARAVLALAPDALLSEAYLVMRVLLDSAMTGGCLLGAAESERNAYAQREARRTDLPGTTAEDFIQHAKRLEVLDEVPPHCFMPLQKRIDELCARTGANPDSWRVLAASIFPHTSEILAGSVASYAFRFGREQKNLGEEFSMLFFMGTEILCDLIRFCSKHIQVEQLYLRAKDIHEQVVRIMDTRISGIEDPAQGGWSRLERLEHLASKRLSPQLREFEDAFKFSYEAALVAPTLRKQSDAGKFRHAALYFRRALNDLRATWVLLTNGYTAQASTCAGSLFESCLAAICLLNDANVREFEAKLQSPTGNDFAWGAMAMAKMVCAKGHDLSVPNPKYENSWRSLYARYVWLSQIRHCTFQSVVHEVAAGKMDCGDYFVMAIPNCTDHDLPVKIGIAVSALADLQDATNAFVSALGYDGVTGNVLFDERKHRSEEVIAKLVGKFSQMKNPITIARTKFVMRHPPLPET